MKKLVVLLVLLVATGCTMFKHKPVDVCERLDKEKGEIYLANTILDEDNYMYLVGYQVAERMKNDNHDPVKVAMHMGHRNITVLGEVTWEKREDGLYLCETSCDFVKGEVVEKRENRCDKVLP